MPFAKNAKATPTYFGSLTGALVFQHPHPGRAYEKAAPAALNTEHMHFG
jgi:hypothetical protein